jgi:hypothetical protein
LLPLNRVLHLPLCFKRFPCGKEGRAVHFAFFLVVRTAMELVLILGMVLTAAGILVGLYLPVLASHFATPEKIRLYAIIGAVLVVLGTATEIFALWPVEVEIDQQSSSD